MTYWEDRFALLEQAQNKTGMDTYRDIEKVLNKTQKEIDKEIEKWIYRISVNNEVSMTEARKLLNSKELKEFKWDVKQYIKYGQENAINQQWLKELENASAKFHISRLEALKIQTQQALEVAYGNQLDSIDGMMRKVYTENYYHTAYEIQKGLHIGFDVGKINENKLNKVLNKPWTTDGKTFSDRIWTKKNQMVGELHQQITRQVIQGKSPDVAIKEMQKYVDSSVKNAKYTASRLVMTEQAFIASASTKDSYHDLDVEFYEILATLDSRTSDVCQDMDGKVFPMKDYSIGATAPPFHVFCRTTTIPHFDDNYGGERIARGEDGQTYYVPDTMKYNDWKACFVDHTKEPDDILDAITSIEAINQIGTDALLKAYEDRRLHFDLNYVPVEDVNRTGWKTVYTDYTGLSEQTAKAFNDVIVELSDEYYTGVQQIIVGEPKDFFGSGVFASTEHVTTVANKILTINPIKMKDYDKMVERIGELSEKGYCVKLAPEFYDKYIATHEFAHTLIDMKSPLKNYVNLDTRLFGKIRKEINKVYDDYMGEINAIRAEIAELKKNPLMKDMKADVTEQFKLFKQIDEKQKQLDALKISNYSMENVDEFFAEAFTQAKIGLNKSSYSDDIIKIVDKYFKKPDVAEDVVEDVVKFIPAKTIKEAEEYAKRFSNKVSFKGITNLDAINEINERLTHLTETYPIEMLDDLSANARLKRADMRANHKLIEFNTSRVNENSVGFDWKARIKENLEKIEKWKEYTDTSKYPKSTVNAYKKAIKEAEKQNKFNRWTFDSETGKIADTLTHEYGHVIADQYFGQINGKRANPNFDHNRNNALYKTVLKVKDTFEQARVSGDIYKLSMYADTDADEFFAEAFAMYVGGEKLPDYIEEMLKGVLENGRL